ncbi:MAG: hypothetical protein ABL907_23080 [Hyphomicrobium sp.]
MDWLLVTYAIAANGIGQANTPLRFATLDECLVAYGRIVQIAEVITQGRKAIGAACWNVKTGQYGARIEASK